MFSQCANRACPEKLSAMLGGMIGDAIVINETIRNRLRPKLEEHGPVWVALGIHQHVEVACGVIC